MDGDHSEGNNPGHRDNPEGDRNNSEGNSTHGGER